MLRGLLVAAALIVSGCTTPWTQQTIAAAGYYPPTPVHVDPSKINSGGEARINGNEVSLTCTIVPMPAFSVAQCKGPFPWTVPVGKTFCLTNVYLQSKYPWDPPRYGGTMHAMYLQGDVMTVSSHFPNLRYNPPYPLPAGAVLRGEVSNGQTEGQNVQLLQQGFLVDAGQPCKR